MSRIKSRNLFDLIKSLDKNEKRYFKVMFAGSETSEDRKMLLLFDHINKQEEFDEEAILKKEPGLKPSQLSNLKAYLYEKIMQSIRQYNASRIYDIKIREQIDFAQLLVERRLYTLGSGCLKKAKKMAKQNNNLELQLEIIKLEKDILTQTGNEADRTDEIIAEVRHINSQINNITIFSNLFIKLNSLYRKIGFIRDESDYFKVKEFFYSSLPAYEEGQLSVAEKIYLYRLFVGYYFFIQDFDQGLTYAKKLEQTLESEELLLENHIELYITSLNNILIAQYKLWRYEEFEQTNSKLHSVKSMVSLHMNESIRIRLLKYYYIHEINKFFMRGNFDKGADFVTRENVNITALIELLDQHSAMIINYKIACLYFGAANYSQSVRWLNKIINISNADIREDLHCFARIINLICHYELGNFDVINYYIISTYRFLFKKDDLHLFQKFILKFLKSLDTEVGNKELLERFTRLKTQLLPLVNSSYEKRAFIYFDIISWLESKIEKRPVQEIIKDKFLMRASKSIQN